MENESNPQDPSQQVRKSKRARKPNSFYVQGIAEIKKPPAKPKKKGKALQEEFNSYSEDKFEREMQENNHSDLDNSEEWYDCQLPDRTRIKIAITVNGAERIVEREKKKEKPKVQAKGQTDLLFLFQKAIEDVAEEEPPKPKPTNPVISKFDMNIEMQKVPSQTYRIPVKRPKDDKDGKINQVKLETGNLKIIHSKLGEIDFPTTWIETKAEPMSEEDQNRLTFLREKLGQKMALPSILPVIVELFPK